MVIKKKYYYERFSKIKTFFKARQRLLVLVLSIIILEITRRTRRILAIALVYLNIYYKK
jgi:hypothetical protein